MENIIGNTILAVFIAITLVCSYVVNKKRYTVTKRDTYGGIYYFLLANIEGTRVKISSGYDYGHAVENRRYQAGNYFSTYQEAEAAKKAMSKIFKRTA